VSEYVEHQVFRLSQDDNILKFSRVKLVLSLKKTVKGGNINVWQCWRIMNEVPSLNMNSMKFWKNGAVYENIQISGQCVWGPWDGKIQVYL